MKRKEKRLDDTRDGLVEQVKFLKSVVQVLLLDLNKLKEELDKKQKGDKNG